MRLPSGHIGAVSACATKNHLEVIRRAMEELQKPSAGDILNATEGGEVEYFVDLDAKIQEELRERGVEARVEKEAIEVTAQELSPVSAWGVDPLMLPLAAMSIKSISLLVSAVLFEEKVMVIGERNNVTAIVRMLVRLVEPIKCVRAKRARS